MKREQIKEAIRPIVKEVITEATKNDFVATYKGILITLKNFTKSRNRIKIKRVTFIW